MKKQVLPRKMFKIKANIGKKAINWLILLLGLTYSPEIMALSPLTEVGVLRSRDNAQQWGQIVNRFQVSGVDFCVLDSQNWQQESDLNKIKVLLIPSVGNITGSQALALDNWVKDGGKLIVAGPTGTLSQTEVQAQLKDLFGAYWGFAVSKPSTLVVEETTIKRNKELSSTISGGVIIPTNINSKTSAVWLSEGKPPAVIMNDNTTFLGWRWGVDNVSSVSFDAAWLNIALKRYGINPVANSINVSIPQEQPCNPKSTQGNQNYPLIPDLNTPNQSKNFNLPIATNNSTIRNNLNNINNLKPPQANVNLTYQNKSQETILIANNNRLKQQGVSSQEVTRMSKELEDLIYRVESTLIAAEAKQLKYNLPMSKVVEQVIKSQDKGEYNNNSNIPLIRTGNTNADKAITEAKQVLENFPKLAIENYSQARQTWLDARRNLWDNYPVDRHFAQPEIRAIWLDRGTIVKARSKADLAKLFDQMAESGINTVFFETVNASYPVYPSRIAPEQNPLTKGWDPLQAAIELAHERGMELHAWAWIFAAANQGHNQILNQPKEYLGPVLSRHPDWVLKDKNGNVFNNTPGFKKAFYDPANPEVRQYILALLDEIATNYDVDGIQLDYIRYPFQDSQTKQVFGYSDVSRALFKQTTGKDPMELTSSSPLWAQWTGFRIQQVDSFVAEVSRHLKAKNPDLVISAAVFPMERKARLGILQQNWEEWINSQWVDMMVLMTYAMHTGSLEDRTRSLYDYTNKGATLIVPGIRLLNVPDKEAVDQMQLLRNMPTGGYALFAAENFNPNLQLMFKQTQGNSKEIAEPVPYRQPFQSAFSRYSALQKEWNFLLINNQIVVESRSLKEWSREADALASSLQKLVSNPSNTTLLTAQSNLDSFQQKLNQWTRLHQQVKPLQVQSWQNRLMTIETLLNYGERTVLNSKF